MNEIAYRTYFPCKQYGGRMKFSRLKYGYGIFLIEIRKSMHAWLLPAIMVLPNNKDICELKISLD